MPDSNRISPLQRRFYWAVLRHIAACTLPDAIQIAAQKVLHNEFKEILLGFEEVISPDGAPCLRPISTTSLDREEFSDYIESVQAVAVAAGVDFPDSPEELLEICPKLIKEHLPLPGGKRKPGPTLSLAA